MVQIKPKFWFLSHAVIFLEVYCDILYFDTSISSISSKKIIPLSHRWCEGTLGVKKSSEETVGIALN